ncbi:hypothetical protein [Mucilaginibacter dorajii]|uniref:Lipoprotein n=1 Tax=Mucilaginibacter dorajii TaxID=692994 RepID=A0ABP7P090_9SPHI|nr:hypothetical protein [Mucilaginibacter dorajii]MCS3735612.1 hypothetical protein [Mucilaginibacter dorajii]
MKPYTKITLALSAIAILIQVSCKKNASAPNPAKTTISTSDLSKQIAFDLYHSLSSGVSASDNLKTNGSNSGLAVMDNSNPCGSFVKGTTNKTVTSGDTTRTYVGHSTFTYMCNGYFNNNWNVDAYTLVDTLKTTETGTGFNNIYDVTLNYVVKSADSHYNSVTIGGTTTTSSYTSKVKNGVISDSHKLSTVYTFTSVAGIRSPTVTMYNFGRVDFSTTAIDNGATNSYSGYILFLSESMAKAFFKNTDGTYTGFSINLLTGEVTAIK